MQMIVQAVVVIIAFVGGGYLYNLTQLSHPCKWCNCLNFQAKITLLMVC